MALSRNLFKSRKYLFATHLRRTARKSLACSALWPLGPAADTGAKRIPFKGLSRGSAALGMGMLGIRVPTAGC